MVKQFLSQKGVKYEERDVSENRAFARELVSSTGQMGVPVTVIDGQVIIGFDRPKLEQAIAAMQPRSRPPDKPTGPPSFGASIADADKILAKQGREAKPGAYVGDTKKGSVAEKMGVIPGDIITAINRKPVSNASELAKELSFLKRGDRFSIIFLRGTRTMTLEATYE